MKAIIEGKEVELSAFTIVTESPEETHDMYLVANEWRNPPGMCKMTGVTAYRMREWSKKQLYLVHFEDLEPLS